MATKEFALNGPLSLFHRLGGTAEDFDLFYNGDRCERAGYPPLDVVATEEGLKVRLSVPGWDAKDIDIDVNGDLLSIKAEAPADDVKEGEQYLIRERHHRGFERKVRLGFAPDADGVAADYHNGVLTVTAKKPESEKPRKIEIKTG